MPDIFDQVSGGQSGDIFDKVQSPQVAAQPQPDIFDQVSAPQPVPQQTQLQYQSQLVPLATPDPQPMQRVQPGQPLQAGVEQNFWQSLPIVQDTTKAWQSGDFMGGAGSFMQGLPAGPLEVLDMGSNLERWLQEQTARAVMDFQLPLQGLQKEMVQQGVIDNVFPKLAGVAPKLDLAGDFKRFVNPKYPGIFGGGAFAGQALIPAGTAAKGASLSQKLGVGALGGALQSGLFDIGGQYRDKGQVNPLQTAASVLLGGGIGGLGAGAIHGLEKVAGNIAQKFAKPMPAQQPQFNPMALQGLDAQAQQEMLALQKLAQQPEQPAPVIQGINDLVEQAQLSNFFKQAEPPAPVAAAPRPQTPEEALAALEALTQQPQAPRVKAGKTEPDPIDVAKARIDLTQTLRAAATQDELDTLSEQATRWVQKNFSNGEVRKAMHAEISRQRKARAAEFEGERPKLDDAVEKLQALDTPEEAEQALEQWAKEALGEDLDPNILRLQSSENVPEFYVLEDKIALDKRESEKFPLAFEAFLWPGKKKLVTMETRLSGDENGFRPNLLSEPDLDRYTEYYQVESQLRSISISQRRNARRALEGLQQERVRREQRKALGIPQDLSQAAGVKEIRQLTDDEIVQVINDGTERQQLAAIQELARRNESEIAKVKQAAQPSQPPAASQPEVGDFRRTIPDSMKGRNKNSLAIDIHENPLFNKRPIRLMLRKFGAAKVEKDYTKARLDDFLKKFKDRFVPQGAETFDLPGGGKMNLKPEEGPSIQSEKDLAAAREKLATGVTEVKKPVIAGMLDKYFGEGPDKIPFTQAEMPEDVETAAKVLRKLYADYKQAEKAYDSLKPSYLQERLDAAEKSLQTKRDAKGFAKDLEAMTSAKTEKARASAAARVEEKQAAIAATEKKVEALKKQLKTAQDDEKLLQSLEKDFAEQVGDPTAPINLKTRVPHPEESVKEPISFALEYRKGQLEHYVPAENIDEWNRVKEEILRRDANRPRKAIWQLDGNSLKGVVPAAGAAIANFFGQAAQAADGAAPAAIKGGVDIMAAWNQTPLTEVATGALLLHKLAPKVAKALLNEEVFAGASLWKNTLDNIDYLGKIGAIDPEFKKVILNHTAQTLKASWGINFDEDAKALGMHYLREGLVTPQEIISGSSTRVGNLATKEHVDAMAHFQSMDLAQKKALAAYKIAQDSLRRAITGEIKKAMDWRSQNVKSGDPMARVVNIDESIKALEYALEQVSPRGGAFNGVDKILARARANFMDAAFFWNVKFHTQNLVTDPFIAGGSLTGPGNVLRAFKLLAFDKELKQLYKDSNLVGGYKAERVQDGVVLKDKGFSLFPKKDIPSDAISADRVSLAALLQYQQINKDTLLKAGFTGSDVDFAKAVLKGDPAIPEAIGADAFIHMTGTLSESLGVDTFRINTDIMSRSKIGSAAGIFFRQPARLSRLGMKYLAEGNFKAFYTMLGFSALVGGATAAIPLEGQIAGQLINPESYFKAADAADKLDMWQKATGNRLGPKTTWSFLWALQAGNTPVMQQPQEALGGMFDAAMAGKGDKFMQSAQKALPLVKPKVMGVPVKLVQDTARAYGEVQKGQIKSYPQSNPITRKPDFKKTMTIPFEKIQRHPLTHFLQNFVAGVENGRYAHQQFYNEQKARKARGQMVPPAQQYNSPADIYSGRTPLDMFFGGLGR